MELTAKGLFLEGRPGGGLAPFFWGTQTGASFIFRGLEEIIKDVEMRNSCALSFTRTAFAISAQGVECDIGEGTRAARIGAALAI